MNEINIIVDESGTMNNDVKDKKYTWTNYFVISGFMTDKDGLQILKSIYLKEELNIKNKNPKYYNKITEIKGVNIIPEDCAIILNSIIKNVKTFIPFSIVVCKKHSIRRTWNENAAFNYFFKLLIKYLLKNNDVGHNKKINIYLDNRGRKTPFRNELKEYLEQDLFLDMIERNYSFNIFYKDSKVLKNSYIRCADLIAYSILKSHENKTKREKEFIAKLKEYNVNLHIHENKTIFPNGTCKINNCHINMIDTNNYLV